MSNWEFIKNNYIDKSLKIFPVQKNGKIPVIDNWLNDCSNDYLQVLYWYLNCNEYNWGLPATPNGLFVLDLDVHDKDKNGIKNFEQLLNDILPNDLPFNVSINDLHTLVQKTPSGGMHVIFKTDNDLKNVVNSANVFENYQGIDIRTDGYIAVEPSQINGNCYHFVNDYEISEMPKELKEFILNNTHNKEKKEPYKKPTHVDVGDRDNQLFSYINNLYFKTTLEYDEILTLALAFNENVFEKPFKESIVEYKVKKTFEKERNKYIFIKVAN